MKRERRHYGLEYAYMLWHWSMALRYDGFYPFDYALIPDSWEYSCPRVYRLANHLAHRLSIELWQFASWLERVSQGAK